METHNNKMDSTQNMTDLDELDGLDEFDDFDGLEKLGDILSSGINDLETDPDDYPLMAGLAIQDLEGYMSDKRAFRFDEHLNLARAYLRFAFSQTSQISSKRLEYMAHQLNLVTEMKIAERELGIIEDVVGRVRVKRYANGTELVHVGYDDNTGEYSVDRINVRPLNPVAYFFATIAERFRSLRVFKVAGLVGLFFVFTAGALSISPNTNYNIEPLEAAHDQGSPVLEGLSDETIEEVLSVLEGR